MINNIDICQELHQNFIDFAYEANSQRAFPDARDGLKPGQRACLWEMYNKGYSSNKPHVKSAKVSGGVIASWHPHGDVAVYETFARMSQPWINNIPETDWHGANGNQIIGSAPANQRYTEVRLSKATEEGMLKYLKKKCVPMIPNFSEDDEWPLVFPAIFPRLAVNGSQGIGVTIANTWLPMNLVELSSVIENFINTNEVDYNKSLIDFPSGGIIINKNDLPVIHKTGKGKVVLRAKADIKKNSILITELPYQVYVEPLLEDIKTLISKEELSGIKEFYNKSDKKKLLIEIVCDEDPATVLKRLYHLTDLQKSYSANQWALVGKTPELLTLKDYLKIYIQHNINCIQKEYEFDLKKAKDRLEIVDGLLKALLSIDEIIALIKKSDSSSAAKENLIKVYNFSENQAKAIVGMKLGSLARLESVELNEEKAELDKTINEINNILSNEIEQKNILINRLKEFVQKFGGKRRTELTHIEIPKESKEKIAITPEDCVVIMTQTGLIKRIPKSSFKVQRKNGKGVKTADDAILSTLSTNTIDTLMIFSNKGKMYRMLVDNVPNGTNASKGILINNLINLENNEKVIAITSLADNKQPKYVVFITRNGLVKKTLLEEYMKTKRTTGIAAITLKDNDTIANVVFMNEEDLILITKQGFSIHFETKNISAIGRIAAGVKGIKLTENDYVLGGFPIENEKAELAVFTSNGLSKKVPLSEFSLQGRAGKGITVYKSTLSTGELIGATMVLPEDNLLLVGKPNSICISANEIPSLSRISIGNIMIKDSHLHSVIKL